MIISGMNQRSKKLPDSLLVALTVHIYIGWGLLYLAKLAVGHLSYNAYWGIFVALVIIAPFNWIIFNLSQKYPGQSIFQIYQQVFGKTLGIVLSLLYFLHIIYFQMMLFRDSQLMIYTYFFKVTPFMLMTALLMIGASYVAWHGIESVGRLALFALYLPFLAIFGIQLFGLINVNIINLQPVFDGTFRDWLLAGTDMLIILIPGTAVSSFLFYIKKPDSVKKITIASWGMVILLFFFNILGIIGSFGPSLIPRMNWPVVEYFHIIDFPFLLLEQTGLFFLVAWYASIFVTVSVAASIAGNELPFIFPRIKRRWIIPVYAFLTWVLVNLPINLVASETFFKKTYKFLTFSFLSFFLIVWVGSLFRSEKQIRR